MKATSKLLPIVLSTVLSTPLLAQAASIATQETDESGRMDDVLAYAPYRSGEGSIEIRRTTEDGVDGIVVIREARIGDDYRMPEEWTRLPLTERASRVYEDLSGQPLPDEAVAAFRELEALRAMRDASFDLSFPVAPSKNGTCADTGTGDEFFYDCYVYGPIYKIEAKTDDVCLLSAAYKGNHTQTLAYRGVSGKFKLSYSGQVLEGKYRAAELLSEVRRTRKGHVSNSPSDYARFNYEGDTSLEGLTLSGEFPSLCKTVSNS